MTIETKYNIHDKVFYMENNRVRSGSINLIVPPRITPLTVKVDIEYMLCYKDESLAEYLLFATKEDLLKSL